MRRISTFTLMIFLSCSLFGQERLLERKISLKLHDETIENALRKISAAGGFTFSYNPSIIAGTGNVTHNFVDRSLRDILDVIFMGTVNYKARGKYVILTAAPKSSTRKESAVVSGYVVDEATGERLKDVSVYDPITLSSDITDSYGYFEIKIDRPARDIVLSVNRQYYADTIVSVVNKGRLQRVPIRINREKWVVFADSVGEKIKRLWDRRPMFSRNVNLVNVDDTLYRVSQVSLVPFIGTNHKMSAHVINDLSFNILGGYSLGVNRLEIGGLFNLVRGDVGGAQFAGLFNRVGGDMRAVQFAGVFNTNEGRVHGGQFSGVINLSRREARGVFGAGAGNVARDEVRGTQLAGAFNIAAGRGSGAQIAGVFNTVKGSFGGFQGAGVFNVCGSGMKGAQVAGVFNVSRGVHKGIQISPVINVASKIKGSQISLFNIADSVKGVPIGLLSFVWKGYHKIEIAADEIFYTNLAFRTGVSQLYNIFSVGAKPSTYREEETVWTFGYGLGTAPRISRKLFLNFDLTSNQIVVGNQIERINLLNKAYVGFDYQAFRKMSVTFGATVNGHLTRNSSDGYQSIFTDYQPKIFLDRDLGSRNNLKMWIGGKVGIRFL